MNLLVKIERELFLGEQTAQDICYNVESVVVVLRCVLQTHWHLLLNYLLDLKVTVTSSSNLKLYPVSTAGLRANDLYF